MDESGPTVSILLFIVLLAVDFVFYGFGAAVRKLNYAAVRKADDAAKGKKTKKLLTILDEPELYIDTIQVVTTISNIVMGGYFLKNLYRFVNHMLKEHTTGKALELLTKQPFSSLLFLLTVFVLLFVILTNGVLVPKKAAERSAETWAYVWIGPIYFVMVVLRPFTGLVTLATKGILKLFGLNTGMNPSDVTEQEILSMVNEGLEQGVFQASEAKMITNIFELSDKEAKDIMTHRSNIVGIDGEITLKECVDFMLNIGTNSRYPVYIDSIDHIIGIIHIKDAFKFLEKGSFDGKPIKNIRNLVREARFVPETKKIDSLFHSMQALKSHMVIVIDEYGQTSGLVAMEDILEEIVGNILDEYDEDEVLYEEKGQDQYEIDGLTPLEELEELLGIKFEQEEFETLNGVMVAALERIPQENEQFDMDYAGYNFKVLSVENKVIRRVLVTKIKPKEAKKASQKVPQKETKKDLPKEAKKETKKETKKGEA
ncbi:MAG: HlyC/CorC family transporter [Lachnospiraceae bacterium]|nr:HlyC/CorC family transporter [Lachnospiraceae bacterium]